MHKPIDGYDDSRQWALDSGFTSFESTAEHIKVHLDNAAEEYRVAQSSLVVDRLDVLKRCRAQIADVHDECEALGQFVHFLILEVEQGPITKDGEPFLQDGRDWIDAFLDVVSYINMKMEERMFVQGIVGRLFGTDDEPDDDDPSDFQPGGYL